MLHSSFRVVAFALSLVLVAGVEVPTPAGACTLLPIHSDLFVRPEGERAWPLAASELLEVSLTSRGRSGQEGGPLGCRTESPCGVIHHVTLVLELDLPEEPDAHLFEVALSGEAASGLASFLNGRFVQPQEGSNRLEFSVQGGSAPLREGTLVARVRTFDGLETYGAWSTPFELELD